MKFIKFIPVAFTLILCCSCFDFKKTQVISSFELKNVLFDEDTYDCVILGGGIGGLSASIYLSISSYQPLVIQGGIPGGLITQSHIVENWPGEIRISGQELTDKIKNQALAHHVKFLTVKTESVDFSTWPYLIFIKDLTNDSKGSQIKALSCIITMGSTPNLLNIPGEGKYFGRGVSTCAICDGNLHKNRIVAVVGGGESAVTEALYLSKIAKQVYLIVRGDKLKANLKQINNINSTANIETVFNTKVVEINGDDKSITSIEILDTKKHIQKTLKLDGLFLAIGSTPNSKIFKNQLELDDKGYIKLFNYQETSKKGIFSAGDISDPRFKQAMTAAGDSIKAALQAIEFLQNIGYTPLRSILPETKPITEKVIPEKSHVVKIENEQQFKKILTQKTPNLVIANFYGDFCIPCQQMHPIFKKLAKEYMGKVIFTEINISKNSPFLSKYSIASIPTFIIFKDGTQIKRFSGSQEYDKLNREIVIALS